MQSFKKITEANTKKMDTKFACKNPHFDFHAGQFTRDTVIQESRHELISLSIGLEVAQWEGGEWGLLLPVLT